MPDLDSNTSESDEDSYSHARPRVSNSGAVLFVVIVIAVGLCAIVALGTALAAVSQVVAGWTKLSTLHILVASVAVLLTGGCLFGALVLRSSLNDIRDTLNGTGDPPLGFLQRLMREGMVEESVNSTSPPKPRRRSRRKPPA
jgi:hypothetical protein